jgi:hypothetical protein
MSPPSKPPQKPETPPKSKEEAEIEAKIARQILAKNPKLRDAGFDTAWIVERQSTARKKGATLAAAGSIDTTDLDALREAYDERVAAIEAQMSELRQTLLDTKRGAREAVKKWTDEHQDPKERALVKHALDVRRVFLDAIGYRS